MPRLLLLRHAKAERVRPGQEDHERALAERGRMDGQAMAATIAGSGERPDLVLCSTSRRTRETWEQVREALAEAPRERFLRGLYEAGRDYLSILRREGGSTQSLLIVGHNPAIHQTAVRLAADLGSPDGAALSAHFPTASLAILEFDGQWPEVAPESMRLTAFVTPGSGDD